MRRSDTYITSVVRVDNVLPAPAPKMLVPSVVVAVLLTCQLLGMNYTRGNSYVVAVTPLVVVTTTVEEGKVDVELLVIVLPAESVVVTAITVTPPAVAGRRSLIFDARASI